MDAAELKEHNTNLDVCRAWISFHGLNPDNFQITWEEAPSFSFSKKKKIYYVYNKAFSAPFVRGDCISEKQRNSDFMIEMEPYNSSISIICDSRGGTGGNRDNPHNLLWKYQQPKNPPKEELKEELGELQASFQPKDGAAQFDSSTPKYTIPIYRRDSYPKQDQKLTGTKATMTINGGKQLNGYLNDVGEFVPDKDSILELLKEQYRRDTDF